MTEPFRLRYVNEIVGGFILTVVLLLLLFVVYLVRANELLARSLAYEMVIQQRDLDGLRTGTEVIVLGHSAGRIVKIEYVGASTDLRMSLTLKATFKDSVFEDSIVRLRRHFGVGEPYLEIIRGQMANRILQPPADGGPAILKHFVPEEDRVDVLSAELTEVSKTIADVKLSLIPALESLNQGAQKVGNGALQMGATYSNSVGPAADKVGKASEAVAVSAEKSQERLDRTLKRYEETAAKIDESVQVVRDAIEGLEQEANDAVIQIRDTAATAEKSIKSLEGEATASLRQFNAASKDMQTLMRDGQRVVGVLNNEVPGTMDKVNDTVDGAGDVMDGLKQNWLLRRYIRPVPSTRQVPPSSLRGSGG